MNNHLPLESSPLHLDHLVSSLKESVKHQHLKQLAKKVPNIIKKSRAVNTFKKYSTYFNQWKNWCKNFSLPSLSAKEEHVALYLTSLLQNQKSSAIIESTYYAIEHFHKLNILETLFRSYLCSLILEAAKREKPRQNKKDPIKAKHLKEIYYIIGKTKFCSLLDLRTFTMMIISYAGFLRYDEISDLKA